MEVRQCRNLIESARIVKAPGSAIPVTGQADCLYKKGKFALPATLMAAGSVKTVAAWAALMLRAIQQLSQSMVDDLETAGCQ